MSDRLSDLLDRLDRAVLRSRLNSIATLLFVDRRDRIDRIAQVLCLLGDGAYLLGTGPGTAGVVPLSVHEVVLGRAATPLEQPGGIVDYQVTDAVFLGPHEVSRVHAKICRERTESGTSYRLVDLGSTLGTYHNGKSIVDPKAEPQLATGDVISLGPSHVSTYVFVEHLRQLLGATMPEN